MSSRCTPLVLLIALAFPGACRIFPKSPGITVSTDPPGARVVVDGKDSGFVTPCALALDVGEDYRIDLERAGYVTASRYVTSDRRVYVILWREMYVDPTVWHFPLWLNFRDFFVPVKFERGHAPQRLYVRLERSNER